MSIKVKNKTLKSKKYNHLENNFQMAKKRKYIILIHLSLLIVSIVIKKKIKNPQATTQHQITSSSVFNEQYINVVTFKKQKKI